MVTRTAENLRAKTVPKFMTSSFLITLMDLHQIKISKQLENTKLFAQSGVDTV